MNTRCLSAILAAIFLAAGLPSVANATLADDSNAIISDSVSISRTTNPKFFAHIDYAVYSPGEYPGSLTFPADKYVYCYQLFNVSTSTSNIMSLDINIDPDASVDSTNYDTASLSGIAGGINPAVYIYSRDQVQYGFTSRNLVTVNQHSSVLIFTSAFAPDSIMGTGFLGTTTAGNFTIQLPVPTPEPASLLLLALASPVLLNARRRKILKTTQ
jgi:hypothetical protein